MNYVSARVSSFRLPQLSFRREEAKSNDDTSGQGLLPARFSIEPQSDTEGQAVTGQVAEEACSLCKSLSWKERLMGFAFCWGAGSLLMVAAFSSWGAVLLGRPQKFAMTYTLGNILNVGSTCFLVGPARQLKTMRQRSRRVASVVYVCCMAVTYCFNC
eukprot:gnl/MRDRNA2_/MRDRNA2_78801_c0_seq1.p1 gnl/MRDRNA2_/MRDRNA2_78801_c0~~gnl/MRDRNA2_/MRDRNA2_78801_c0_seq1.p1  ORF type:complete len:158 (-),score=19.10 gnl/MRDRNA2_/MRDRNA2_78801_c0_seq1:74-547(-)